LDRRTKRQKLEDMANQTVSPNEAEIARKKLDELPPDPPQTFMAGTTIEVTIKGAMFSWDDSSDPGMGVFDFAKGEWTWYPRTKGSGEGF